MAELTAGGFEGGGAGLLEPADFAATPDLGGIVLGGEGGDFPVLPDNSSGPGLISAASRGGSVGSLFVDDVLTDPALLSTGRSEEDFSTVISDFINQPVASKRRSAPDERLSAASGDVN